MTVSSRIVEARGGDVIAGECVLQNASLQKAAAHFGLRFAADLYEEVDAAEAEAVLIEVLTKDMAYHSDLVPQDEAQVLASAFVSQFKNEAPKFYTNGEFGKRRKSPSVGASWNPATEATFDTGVLVVAANHIACAWFMDED